MRAFALAAVLVVVSACSQGGDPEIPHPQQTPAHSNTAGEGRSVAPSAPSESPKTNTAASNTDDGDAVAELQKTYDSNPSDPAAKASLLKALIERANALMSDPSIPPFQKYPAALGLFRRANRLDPNDKAARAGIDTIESIYKQMNKPIPQV